MLHSFPLFAIFPWTADRGILQKINADSVQQQIIKRHRELYMLSYPVMYTIFSIQIQILSSCILVLYHWLFNVPELLQ